MKAKDLLDGWVEVFKAGKHIDSGGKMHEFTKEDVKQRFSIQLWDLKFLTW